ncbi:MAG TPA: hypothetical protein VF088_03110 [Pyrinomonadaceae bacterium]
MKVRSRLFYRIETAAFFLYWKTFYYPRLERIAWRLYRSLFRGLCAVLKPFDNSDKLAATRIPCYQPGDHSS